MHPPDENSVQSIDVTVTLSDDTVEEVEEELCKRGREKDGSAFLDLVMQRLDIEFGNLPSYCDSAP
ncbi:hypothetical protein [Haloarchaeobius sp. TZWWS8]|uniref:hypothetical protein n=1 Tax=Haloarchaeobius sp. TZWWS8 TaxID=3446121 RepID=UPI003EB96D59